jgi:hypothetical protein
MAAKLGDVTKASILTSRRRMRIAPQTGQAYGSGGAGAANAQVQFLLADASGLIDMRSVVLNYYIRTTGTTTACPDDAHPFSTVQINLNGQNLENLQNAAKVANIEAKLGGSKSYMQTAGSFQGFGLLSNDTNSTVPTTDASNLLASYGQYGYVLGNVTDLTARAKRAADVRIGNVAGMQVSIPLGSMSGVGRMKTYVPLALLGEININLIALSAAEALFQSTATADADYSLSNVTLEYDIVTASPAYMSLLKQIATEDARGIVMPFESTVCVPGAAIAASTSSLAESTVIVSRATQNLLRAHIVQVQTSALSSLAAPSQSMFSRAGTASVQFRSGSSVFPQIACFGDAALFNMSLAAYGSVVQENGSAINRALWGQSTNGGTQGTAATYETAQASSGGTTKFCYADSCIPSYGFQTYKGGVDPVDVDGISLSGSSGSQLIASIVSAPSTAYTPYISLVALKFLSAKGGVVQVAGA